MAGIVRFHEWYSDHIFDCLDIDELVLQIASGNNNSLFDMTGDGLVDLADRDAWLAEAGEVNIGPGRPYLLGDANLDGFVDGQDFIVWNENRFTPVAAWCSGDFNADGFVDGADFVIWNENKFQGSDGVVDQIDSPLDDLGIRSKICGSRLGA